MSRNAGRRGAQVLALGLAGLVALPTVAHADVVQNDVVADGNGTITAGGSTRVGYKVQVEGNDGQGGCNASDGTPAVVTLSVPSGVTAAGLGAGNKLTFTSCNSFQYVTFSSSTVGQHNINVSSITDAATAGGTYTNSANWTLKVNAATPSDTTPPVITPSIDGTLGNAGWYTTNVGLTWNVSDAESTISSRSGCDAVSVTADQNETTYTCTATSAGGTTSESVSIKRDATAPVVTPGDSSVSDWSKTDVSRSFTASDAMSGLATATDASFSLTASEESATSTDRKTVYDAAGNSTTRTLTAKIDKTNPWISDEDVNDTTWRNTELSREFTAGDVLSGLPADYERFTLTVSEESTNASTPTTTSRTVTDAAGNSETRTLSALIDLTAPVISGADETQNEWSKTGLSKSFTASDALSGLNNSGDAAFTLATTAESPVGGTTTASRTVLDKAGNSATRTISAKVDLSGPQISGSDVAAGAWRNTPLTESFTASDDRSGLANDTDASFSITALAESANATTPTTESKTVLDKVGNSTTRTVSAFIDTTAPVVTISGATSGATYLAGQVPAAQCSTIDALSGVKTAATKTEVGGANGAVTVTCSGAEDNAGNTAAATSVTYRVLTLGGFNKNFDGSGVPKAKAGSAIPLAWSVKAGDNIVSPLTRVVISSAAVASCTDEEGVAGTETAEVAAGSSGLQTLSDGSYQVNWKSSTHTGCRRVTVKMYTGPAESDLLTSRSVNFNFTK